MIHPGAPHRIVETVRSSVAQCSDFTAFAVVGSCTRGYVPCPANVDFLALTRREIGLAEIAATLGPLWKVADDTVRSEMDGFGIGIAAFGEESFEARLRGLLAGSGATVRYAPWALGAAPPEVFCADICDCEVLAGDGRLSFWKRQSTDYPAPPRRRILEESRDLLSAAGQLAKHALEYDEPVTVDLILGQVALASLRAEFAHARQYFRGLRYLERQLAAYLSPPPARLAAFLDLRAPRPERIAALQEILAATVDESEHSR